jgi:hypothetical protein
MEHCDTLRNHCADFVPNRFQRIRGFPDFGVDFCLSQPAPQAFHILRAFSQDLGKVLYILNTVARVRQEIRNCLGGSRSEFTAFFQDSGPIGRHVSLPNTATRPPHFYETKEMDRSQATRPSSLYSRLTS